MKAQKDLSTRLRDMRLEFQEMEGELRSTSESDARALREFRHSLDDLRMTAWTVSELMNARSTGKNPKVFMSFLAAERLRRFSQMTRDLSSELEDGSFMAETFGHGTPASGSHAAARAGVQLGAYHDSYSGEKRLRPAHQRWTSTHLYSAG